MYEHRPFSIFFYKKKKKPYFAFFPLLIIYDFCVVLILFSSGFPLLVLFCSDWTKVEEDCRKAIKLDGSSVKVWYPNLWFTSSFLSLVLLTMHCFLETSLIPYAVIIINACSFCWY